MLERPPVPPVGVPVTPRNQAAGEGSEQTGTKITVSPPSPETAEPLRPPPAVSSFQLGSRDPEHWGECIPWGTGTHRLVIHGPPFCVQMGIRHQG